MSSGIRLSESGVAVGTGADLNILNTLGIKPRYVRVWNTSSGDSMEWCEAMGPDKAFKRVAAGTGSLVSSNGITALANGFALGADADVNASAENLVWYVSQ